MVDKTSFIGMIRDIFDNLTVINTVNESSQSISENLTAIQNAASNAQQVASDKEEVQEIRDELTELNVTAVLLDSSQEAFATYEKSNGLLRLGVPRGLQGLRGESYNPDEQGTLANRTSFDDQGKGFSYLATDQTPSTIYFKASDISGDWDNGSPFGQGEQGLGVKLIRIKEGTTSTVEFVLDDDTVAGEVIITKQLLGLGNVDNTSDANKPLSIAVQIALNGKANTSHTHTESDITDLDKYTQNEVDQKISQLKTTTPTLSGVSEGVEGSSIVVTISNYSATATYTVSVEAGSFTRTDDKITWTLPVFTGIDDIHNLTIKALETGKVDSDIVTHTVTVLDIESDQTILFQDATINTTTFPTVTDVDLSSNTILATSDNATATSMTVSQDIGDGDFVNATPTIDSKAINYTIDSATNTSITISGQSISDGDIILINDGDSVSLQGFDTTGKLTDNGDSTYTINLSSATLTNAPTIVAKQIPDIETSLVPTGAAESFEIRVPQSYTADTNGVTKIADGSANTSTENVVPIMSSNTSPSGTAFAYTNDTNAFQVFDGVIGNNSNKWQGSSGVSDFVGYIHTTPKAINKYTISADAIQYQRVPKQHRLQGSNDTTNGTDGTWVDLHTVNTDQIYTSSETKTFTLTNDTPYKAHRIQNDKVGSDQYTDISEIKFIEAETVAVSLITSLFDTDIRQGRDFKVRVGMKNGYEVSRISIPVDKLA